MTITRVCTWACICAFGVGMYDYNTRVHVGVCAFGVGMYDYNTCVHVGVCAFGVGIYDYNTCVHMGMYLCTRVRAGSLLSLLPDGDRGQ